MKHLSSAALFQKLKSPNIMERVLAAEELGDRRQRSAVGPLRELLDADRSSLEDLDAVAPALAALVAIGDDSAVRSILSVLRTTGGYVPQTESRPLSELACRALVQLDAKAAIPALKELQISKLSNVYRTQLARAIAALGGLEQLGFFQVLLASGDPMRQMAGIAAFAALHHLPAAPLIEPLCHAPHLELRWLAQCALAAMDHPGAREQLFTAALGIAELPIKMMLLCLTADNDLIPLGELLLRLARDPRWANGEDDVLFETLDTAIHLGCIEAATLLYQIYKDPLSSRCKSIRAAGILTERGCANLLSECLEFLLAGGEATRRDPRDSPRRRNTTQREVIQAVTRYGRQHTFLRETIVECLYEVSWRGLDEAELLDKEASYIPDYASHGVYILSGAITRSELDLWRLAHANN